MARPPSHAIRARQADSSTGRLAPMNPVLAAVLILAGWTLLSVGVGLIAGRALRRVSRHYAEP